MANLNNWIKQPINAGDINAATITYVNEQIANITSGVSKLSIIPQVITATTDGQTEFEITLETYDEKTDNVFVLDGRGVLTPSVDFTVSGRIVNLNEGWNAGDTGSLLVFKNVLTGEEGAVSGEVIVDGSIPLSKLEEMPVSSSIKIVRWSN